jgi:lysophosphatidylcholine acyltransferase/lyso-PAF acetyltransferase
MCLPFFLLMFQQSEAKNQPEEPERPGAIISNHVSYLDILYHMSSSFSSFVAKVS